jgi:hypothetical protein
LVKKMKRTMTTAWAALIMIIFQRKDPKQRQVFRIYEKSSVLAAMASMLIRRKCCF